MGRRPGVTATSAQTGDWPRSASRPPSMLSTPSCSSLWKGSAATAYLQSAWMQAGGAAACVLPGIGTPQPSHNTHDPVSSCCWVNIPCSSVKPACNVEPFPSQQACGLVIKLLALCQALAYSCMLLVLSMPMPNLCANQAYAMLCSQNMTPFNFMPACSAYFFRHASGKMGTYSALQGIGLSSVSRSRDRVCLTDFQRTLQ